MLPLTKQELYNNITPGGTTVTNVTMAATKTCTNYSFFFFSFFKHNAGSSLIFCAFLIENLEVFGLELLKITSGSET